MAAGRNAAERLRRISSGIPRLTALHANCLRREYLHQDEALNVLCGFILGKILSGVAIGGAIGPSPDGDARGQKAPSLRHHSPASR